MAGLDHVTVTVDESREVLHRAEGMLDFEASLPGLGARDCVDLETPLGLLQSTFEELLPLVQAGVADFEILTTIRQLRRAGIESCARLAASLRRLGLGSFAGIESRHQGVELGDSAVLAIQPFFGLANSVLAVISDSAWVSRRSVWVRANASELAENPASWVSSWRLSSASR